jgi:transposase
MWTPKIAPDPDKLRYPSDLSNAEWAHIQPLIPPAKRGGGKRRVNMREVVNGVVYILSTGCQWRDLPKDLPPRSTVNDYFCSWSYDGTLENIHHALFVKCRQQAEREASPTTCILDSQSVKERGKRGTH